jgi:thiol-disulfide isomerase/thioredoxin
MKKLITILALLMASHFTNAQPVRKMKMDQLLKMIDTVKTPLVVNFWATWCGPCIREIPWFEKTMKEFADKKVKLILVSIDYPADYAGISAFAKKQGFTSEIIWLNETDADVFCPKIDKAWQNTIPVTLMVNNKSKYRQFYNQQLPELKLLQELQKLVE